MPPKTRNKSGGIDPAVVFPSMPQFMPSSQLPTNKSILGVLLHMTSGGAAQTKHSDAVREVSKLTYAKWYHDTVFCISLSSVVRRVDEMWQTFREGRRRYGEGRVDGKAMEKYKELVNNVNKLFDIGATTAKQRQNCLDDWGVSMSEHEERYYADQKSDRKMECDKSVDPVWYWATMRKERMKAREEEHRRQRQEQFQFKNLDQITEILVEECGGVSSSSTDVSPESPGVMTRSSAAINGPSLKKRKLFVGYENEAAHSDFSDEMVHVRDSERKVKDSFYLTVAALSGHGMSISETCFAVVEVANIMFGRQWKMPATDSITFDLDTLPAVPNIRAKLKLIEAETLSLATTHIVEAKEAGRAITAAIDSTTKRGVGQFATQGTYNHFNININIFEARIYRKGSKKNEICIKTKYSRYPHWQRHTSSITSDWHQWGINRGGGTSN